MSTASIAFFLLSVYTQRLITVWSHVIGCSSWQGSFRHAGTIISRNAAAGLQQTKQCRIVFFYVGNTGKKRQIGVNERKRTDLSARCVFECVICIKKEQKTQLSVTDEATNHNYNFILPARYKSDPRTEREPANVSASSVRRWPVSTRTVKSDNGWNKAVTAQIYSHLPCLFMLTEDRFAFSHLLCTVRTENITSNPNTPVCNQHHGKRINSTLNARC